MITLAQVRDWMKAFDTGVTDWAVGAIDMNKTEAACVYGTRPSPLQPVALGGASGYGVRAFTILVRWGRSASPCEKAAFDIWEALPRDGMVTIGDSECWIIARNLPVMLGKDNAGIFEATIDFEVWTQEGASP